MTCSATARTGFTLIELSIVLVILGLLVGGVLAGRDLIAAAELRQAVETAVRTFELKYDCLPGDCSDQAGRLGLVPYDGTAANYPNGNGNDRYDQTYGGQASEGTTRLWEALAKAGLSPWPASGLFGTGLVPGVNVPDRPWLRSARAVVAAGYNNNALPLSLYAVDDWPCFPDSASGCEPWQPQMVNHVVPGHRLVVGPIAGSQFSLAGGASCAFDRAVDTKRDDGMPASGRVRALAAGYDYRYCLNWDATSGPPPASQPYLSNPSVSRSSPLAVQF